MLRAQEFHLVAAVTCLVLAPAMARAVPLTLQPADLQSRLVRAVGSKDHVELERAAARLGVSGLLGSLKSGQRPVVTAALVAAPLVEQNWQLLGPLIGLIRQPGTERALASLAGNAVLRIAEDLRQSELELDEEIAPLVEARLLELLRVAADQTISLDVRVRALLAAAHMTSVVRVGEERLLPFLGESEPRLRQAAVELFAAELSPAASGRLAQLVTGDPSLQVSRAAAVTLCARVPLGGAAASAELAALRKANAGPRLRMFVESLDATDDQLVDLSHCLLGLGSAEDRQAMQQLQQRNPRLHRLLPRMR